MSSKALADLSDEELSAAYEQAKTAGETAMAVEIACGDELSIRAKVTAARLALAQAEREAKNARDARAELGKPKPKDEPDKAEPAADQETVQ